MGRPRKNKQIETHGKIEEPAPPANAPFVPTRLEQIWGGFNEMSRYGTLKEEEYETQLNDMNRTDMEAHARRLGIIILESSARLKESLKKEFRVYISTLNRPTVATSAVTSKNTEVSSAVKKILAEGR